MSCQSRPAKKTAGTAVLLCIGCSGGTPDANGAYTVCAICELSGVMDKAA